MLKIEQIESGYSGAPVIFDVSFHVDQGELVSIVGSNGAGKTTLLKTIAGTLKCNKGKILLFDKNISNCAPGEIVKSGITYVPEDRLLFAPLTIEENLELGAFTVEDKEERIRSFEFVYNMFPILKDRKKQKSGSLSGGQQQMLAIARGLMSSPKLLMLDEPSLGLMPKLVDEVLETVSKLKNSITILLVEQNVREALEMADRAYVLQTGKVISEGTGKELLESDIVREAFLGL
jgi:branched-chain amino acid transport system ATP-binding protein